MTGWIFDIKEMAVHDGPGLRTTVFFKGCPPALSVVPQPGGPFRSTPADVQGQSVPELRPVPETL